MAAYINHDNIKVVTKNGEVTLHLKIDLNINLNGDIQNNPNNIYSKKSDDTTIINSSEEKTAWEIPDFSSIKTKLNFGKKEE